MALKTNVLVENISNLSEARYCAGMGVQFLALPTNLVNPSLFAAIAGWVQGPKMVVDIRETEALLFNINDYNADFILVKSQQLPQITHQTSAPLFVELESADQKNLATLVQYQTRIHFVVVNDNRNESIEKLFASQFRVLVRPMPNEFSKLGSEPIPFAGIILSGEAENSPGLKNYDHLSSVLEELEIEDD